ncbi:hypothetical protein MNBD_GAMMA18-554 [hydrothermal vent metagenome]|uniref:Uncharacterized protein n=1 Tax=hydrothermal vent metagenome TaxID=652676 RepID=A0A3B0ZZ59_9ZZZZ
MNSPAAASMAPPPFGTAADVVSLGRSLWKSDWRAAKYPNEWKSNNLSLLSP